MYGVGCLVVSAEETRSDDELDGNSTRGVAMEDRNGANEVAVED